MHNYAVLHYTYLQMLSEPPELLMLFCAEQSEHKRFCSLQRTVLFEITCRLINEGVGMLSYTEAYSLDNIGEIHI